MRRCRARPGTRCASSSRGTQIRVSLDGKRYIELDDSHIAGAGAVGVWTKADSVTAFDDFSFGAARP